MADPPVELYAAIVRNTLARFPNTALDYLGIQSNGRPSATGGPEISRRSA